MDLRLRVSPPISKSERLWSGDAVWLGTIKRYAAQSQKGVAYNESSMHTRTETEAASKQPSKQANNKTRQARLID